MGILVVSYESIRILVWCDGYTSGDIFAMISPAIDSRMATLLRSRRCELNSGLSQ